MAIEPVKTSRRERQAAATRDDILEAARRLFAERGYAATAIADIAREAGVAVQTIYSSVGSKRALLGALLDHIDRGAGVGEYERKVRTIDDSHEEVAMGVKVTRTFNETYGDVIRALVSAAHVEPEMAEVLADGRARHRNGTRRAVERIARKYGLREGVSVRRGADVFSALTSSDMWQQLHDDHGWSWDQIDAWMTQTLIGLLLPD